MGPQSKQVNQGRIFLIGVIVSQILDMRQLHVVPPLVVDGADGCYIAKREKALGHVLHRAEARDSVIFDRETWPKEARKLSWPSGGVGVPEVVGGRSTEDIDQVGVSDLALVYRCAPVVLVVSDGSIDTGMGPCDHKRMGIVSRIEGQYWRMIQMTVSRNVIDVGNGFCEEQEAQVRRQPRRSSEQGCSKGQRRDGE